MTPLDLSSPRRRVHRSTCTLDCPDGCSLAVTTEGTRIVAIDGDHRNPLTGGLICGKVRRYAEHVSCPERLLHPARRKGPKGSGEFEPVSWDEALGLLADKLLAVRREYGGEAILPICYGGSNGLLSQGAADTRLFARLGASRLARKLCAAPTTAAHQGLYGKMPGVALTDYDKAELIVAWGVNPEVSGIHLIPPIHRARSAGAKLVVIDPRCTKLAAQADLHLAPRPGTDLPLALSVIRWLFAESRADEEFLARHATGADKLRTRAAGWSFQRAAAVSGVDATLIERFAESYAAASPAVIRSGWGVERNRNGGSAVAAILALPAVAGKFGVRGGGFTASNSGAWQLAKDAAANASWPDTREINLNQVGQALTAATDPPIKLALVYNNNPLATLPAQEKVRTGLTREDLFTVVFDQVLTDTARYADLLLPATTFLEHTELTRSYGAFSLSLATAAIPPRGEARSNIEVFSELCRRTGLAMPDDPESAEAAVANILMASPETGQLASKLQDPGVADPPCGHEPVQFQDLLPLTPDGKIHLCPETLDREAPRGLYGFQEDPASPRFPLALISPANSRRINSTFGQLSTKPATVQLHAVDAAARGIHEGDRIRLFNESGEVVCRASLTDKLPPGTACLEKGLWSHHTENGATANALCPDTLTDLGGGACFNDARVEIEKL